MDELRDRRERGLCFNCDEKFIPSHRCAKLFWLELKDDDGGAFIGENKDDDPEI